MTASQIYCYSNNKDTLFSEIRGITDNFLILIDI